MNEPEIDLTPYGLIRPEKIRWIFPYAEDTLSVVKSKTLRSFLRNIDARMEQNAMHFTHAILDEQSYQEWRRYYVEQMQETGYTIFAKEDFFTQKLPSETAEVIFLYKGDEIVGTEVFKIDSDTGIANACYKTNKAVPDFEKKRLSIGGVLDYLFIRIARERGFTNIRFGSSRNAFGVINKIGNLEYKLRYGYQPVVQEDMTMNTQVPVGEKGFVAFHAVKGDELKLVILDTDSSRDPSFWDEIKHFSPPVPFEIIYL